MGRIILDTFGGWWPSSDPYKAVPGSLLKMDNMTMDDKGVIRPRMGSRLLYTPIDDDDTAISNIFSAMVGVKKVTVVQSGTAILASVQNSGLIVPTLDPIDTLAVSSDAAFGSYMGNVFYAAEQSRRRYDLAQDDTFNWGIQNKPNAPTLAAVAQVTTTIATCDSGESPAFSCEEGTKSFEEGYTGSANTAIKVIPAATGRATITKIFSADTDLLNFGSVEGGDADLFDMMVWLAAPDKIETISIMFGMQGTATDPFRDDYFYFDFRLGGARQSTVNVKAPSSIEREIRDLISSADAVDEPVQVDEAPLFDRAPDIDDIIGRRPYGEGTRSRERQDQSYNPGWTHLTVPRGQFNRVGGTTGRDWKTITAIRVVVKTTSGVDEVRYDNIRFIGDGQAALNGSFRFRIQPVSKSGDYEDRGQPSEPTDPIIVQQQRVKVTIPAATIAALSAEDDISEFWIYAYGGYLDRYYKAGVATVADVDGGGDWVVTLAKSEARMLIDNVTLGVCQPAPEDIIGVDGPHRFRLFALTSTGYVYPSQRLRPGTFNYSHAIRLGDSTGTPLWIKRTSLGLYVGTTKDIYAITGDGEESDGIANFRLDPLNVGDPPIDKCVATSGNSVYYRGVRGIFELNGYTIQRVNHDAIETLISGLTQVEDGAGTCTNRYDVAAWPMGTAINTDSLRYRMVVHNGCLVILVPSSGLGLPFIYKHYLGTNRWEREVYDASYDLRAIAVDPDNWLLGGCGTSRVVFWLHSYFKNATDFWPAYPADDLADGSIKTIPIEVIWPYSDGGLPNQYKNLLDYNVKIAQYSEDPRFNIGIKIDSDDNAGNYYGTAMAPTLPPMADPSLASPFGKQLPNIATYRNKLSNDIPPGILIQVRIWRDAEEIEPPTPACLGSLTGVIAIGDALITGANGWALLCPEDDEQDPIAPVQADGDGVFTFEDVPCGDYKLVVWSENDEAYQDVGFEPTHTVSNGVETDVGTLTLDETGAHPPCP